MGDKSGIEWTDATWNPLVGCRKVSAGCRGCYAEVDALRVLRQMRALAAKRPDGATPKMLRTIVAYASVLMQDDDGHHLPRWNGEVALLPERLEQPLRWRKPRRVFANSMSDLFHEAVRFEYVAAVFAVMGAASQHTFQLLTKRPERMVEFFAWLDAKAGVGQGEGRDDDLLRLQFLASSAKAYAISTPIDPYWPLPNVWLGVSVEDQATADERVPWLLRCPAAVRWLSMEPLLGPVDVGRYMGVRHEDEWTADGVAITNPDQSLADAAGVPFHDPWVAGVDWVVVGGESGDTARPMHPQWVRDIRDQCADAGTPFFFKQWGEWGLSVWEPRDEWGVPGTMERFTTVSSTDRRRVGRSTYRCYSTAAHGLERTEVLECIGKKRAGRELDGHTHDDYPRAAGEER